MSSNADRRCLVPLGSPERRYEVLQEIEAGAMAALHLACRCGVPGCQLLVELKEARASRPGETVSSDLLAHEAYVASRVHHPNVVDLLDVEDVDGGLVLVVEYVEGVDLATLIAAGPVPPAIVARIMQDACAGLEAIHAATDDAGNRLGLTHRDVCPQNIVVGSDGVGRIAELGAAAAHGACRRARIGLLQGRAEYMAPEYAHSGVAAPSHDLYALAVSAWEALTGRRLYRHQATLDDVMRRRDLATPPPTSLVSDVPAGWDPLLARALGRGQLAPFHDVTELQDALSIACVAKPASAREVGDFVEAVASASLAQQRALIAAHRADMTDVGESGVHSMVPATDRATAGWRGVGPRPAIQRAG